MPENETETIVFDEENSYDLKGIKYVVVSHFNDNGENILDKLVRLLKSDIQNTLSQNL